MRGRPTPPYASMSALMETAARRKTAKRYRHHDISHVLLIVRSRISKTHPVWLCGCAEIVGVILFFFFGVDVSAFLLFFILLASFVEKTNERRLWDNSSTVL